MGIYQIFFLSKIPHSAACNEAVQLTKKYGHQGTVKFVNAVLRNSIRSPEKIQYPDKEQNPSKYLALKYFHPEWLVSRWLARLGTTACEELCMANNSTPPLSLRTNTLKITRDELLNRLLNEKIDCEPSIWTPEGIICWTYPAISRLSALQEGLFQVQDESSMLVAHVLDPKPGEFIIDACGAPGGKSTHIAALMQNEGTILSTDIHEHKLEITRENATRLGITIIKTEVVDAVQLGGLYPGRADRVLVDAPCSGLGVLRRKPDSRWRKNQAMFRELSILQQSILQSAANCLKAGGVLVYSTCTTEPEENEMVIKKFLDERSDFNLQTTGQFLPVEKKIDTMVQLWPHKDNVDGFFITRLQKIR
jgi:16S rRNA (cytosine967-C5)-methyltransferase